jgi:hypothetical protein
MLFRPSGGLAYHWLAARSRLRWRPFRIAVEQALTDWNPPGEELILLGPSGGYTLPTAWLRRFKKIHAYDTDPLAPFFFRRRHGHCHAEFLRRDLFWRDGKISGDAFAELLAKRPAAAVLFSNLLGQLPLEGSLGDAEWREFLTALATALTGRAYASYHDLYTLEPLPLKDHGPVARQFMQGTPVTQLKIPSPVAATDHLMAAVPWPGPVIRRLLPWSLRAKSLQLVEMVFSLKN